MSDPIDHANDTAQFITDLALHQHLGRMNSPPQLQQIVNGSVECLDCGVEIPPGRLAALSDCVRCIDCQVAYEKESR